MNLFQDICFRALGPHLDYFQGDEEREEFHKKYTALKSSEPEALLGRLDTEEEKLGVLRQISQKMKGSHHEKQESVNKSIAIIIQRRHVLSHKTGWQERNSNSQSMQSGSDQEPQRV